MKIRHLLIISFTALTLTFALNAFLLVIVGVTAPKLLPIIALPLIGFIVIYPIIRHADSVDVVDGVNLSLLIVFIIILSIMLGGIFSPAVIPILIATHTVCLASIFISMFIAYKREHKNQQQFWDAICTGNLEQMQQCITYGANIHATNQDGKTALTIAAENNRAGIFVALIENGANVNAEDRDGDTPLHLAAQAGHTQTALALIQAGANPNIANGNGNGKTPLHLAIYFGRTEIALKLINAGANVNAANHRGETPLHHAARGGHTETALALIQAGANPNMANDNGNTPLHLATYHGYTEIAITLIKMGADVHATDHRPRTPLYIAIEKNKLATALAIIYYGKVSGANVATIEGNRTSQYIQRQYQLATTPLKRTSSYARGFFAEMNPSYRQTMMAGMKIHFMATDIKDGYLTIMNLLRDKSPSGKRPPSSLPYNLLGIILQYAGLLPPNLDINLGELPNLVKTSSTDLEAEARKPNPSLTRQIVSGRRAIPVCTLRRGP